MLKKPKSNVTLHTATPWTDFREHIGDDSGTNGYARECMKAFNRMLADLAPRNALAEIQSVKLGQQCMTWMINTKEEVRYTCGWDLEYLNLLAHFMIAENQEPALTRCSEAKTAVRYSPCEETASKCQQIQLVRPTTR